MWRRRSCRWPLRPARFRTARIEYYRNDEDLVVALAEALRTEYRAIVDAGFLLQLDDARAAVTYDRMVPPASFNDYYRWVARHVEVLNHALEGIPEDRVRYHVCWGSWPDRTRRMSHSRRSSTSFSRFVPGPT